MTESCLAKWVRALLVAGAVAIVVGGCSAAVGSSVRPIDTSGDGNSWEPSRGLISGTVFFDSDILLPSDRSTFEAVTLAGRETRNVFDRRAGGNTSRDGGEYHDVEVYVFEASYEDLPGVSAAGLSIDVVEVLVNTEFEEAEAEHLAESLARSLGQLPAMLRSVVGEIVIHDGNQSWGGGGYHDDSGAFVGVITVHRRHRLGSGFVGEVLMHEAGHSLLDFFVETYDNPEWTDAAMQDDGFASEYAMDFPDREDVTESYGAWFAVRYRSDRMSRALTRWIEQAIPGRLAYFDARLAAGDGGFAPGMCPVVEADCPTGNAGN